MTIASEISRLQQAKGDIKTAISNKGVAVADSDKLDGYAAKIQQISTEPSYMYLTLLIVLLGAFNSLVYNRQDD